MQGLNEVYISRGECNIMQGLNEVYISRVT